MYNSAVFVKHYSLFCFFAEPPAAPQDVECVQVDRQSATIKWKKPKYDGGSQITGYVIEKREGRAASWVPAEETDSSASKCVIKNLIEGYEYEFRVRAKNSAGLGEPGHLAAPVIPTRPLGWFCVSFTLPIVLFSLFWMVIVSLP